MILYGSGDGVESFESTLSNLFIPSGKFGQSKHLIFCIFKYQAEPHT